jgi:PAS domain S-box-containing protein
LIIVPFLPLINPSIEFGFLTGPIAFLLGIFGISSITSFIIRETIWQTQLTSDELRSITDSSLDAIFLIDEKGKITFSNPAAEKMFEYTSKELQGEILHNILAPERYHQAHQDAHSIYQHTRTGNAVGRVLELVGVRKSGKEFPLELSLNSLQVGGEWWAVGTIRDITSRKAVEYQLRKLSQATQQSPVSIVVTDSDGLIEYVNPQFTQLTGYTLEEAIGENPRILKTDYTPRETYDELWKTITDGKIWHGFFVTQGKDGRRFWEEAWISPVFENGQLISYVAVKMDITQRKEMEEEREEQRKELEIFSSLMRHDLRNNIGVILGTHRDCLNAPR